MATYRRQYGFRSHYTQKLANHLPDWHIIRTDESSTGQYFLNAWAMGLGDMADDLDKNRRELYLGTSSTLCRYEAYRAELPQQLTIEPATSRNLLDNASIKFQKAVSKEQPALWNVVNTYLNEDYGLYGNSFLFTPEPDEESFVYQDIPLDVPVGEPLTFSAYVKDTGSYSGAEFDVPYAQIQLVGWNDTGGTQTATSVVELNNASNWVRLSATLTPDRELYKIRVLGRVVYDDPGGLGSSLIPDHVSFFTWGSLGEPPYNDGYADPLGVATFGFYTDGEDLPSTYTLMTSPQLEWGATVTNWNRGRMDIFDAPFRVVIEYPSGPPMELDYLNNQWDLFEDCVPTRVTTLDGVTGDVLSAQSGPTYYEFDGSYWETKYRVTGEYIALYNADLPRETFKTYEILDAWPADSVEEQEYGNVSGLSRTIETVTHWRRRLYIIAKETLAGVTRRVLKVTRSQGINDRLETIRDFDLQYASGTVTSVGFIDGRMDRLALTFADGTQKTVQMYYDYFYWHQDLRQIVVRHPYTGGTLTFIES